jgi:quinol monooxygenase YgiN
MKEDGLPAFGRRAFVAGAMGATAFPMEVFAMEEQPAMLGLIGRMRALPGQRDALIAILLEGTSGMPGCLSYVVARDLADADAIWITEVWDSRASHDASLQIPAVQDAIRRGRPLIAGFDNGHETIPVSGIGLPRNLGDRP